MSNPQNFHAKQPLSAAERLCEVVGPFTDYLGLDPVNRFEGAITALQSNKIGELLVNANAALLGVNPETHHFDSLNYTTGNKGIFKPPHPLHKQPLFDFAVAEGIQQVQTTPKDRAGLESFAVAFCTGVHNIELFARFNKQTIQSLLLALIEPHIDATKIQTMILSRTAELRPHYTTTPADYNLRTVHKNVAATNTEFIVPPRTPDERKAHAAAFITALFGNPDVYFRDTEKTRTVVLKRINAHLLFKGMPLVDSTEITNVREFQIALFKSLAPKEHKSEPLT